MRAGGKPLLLLAAHATPAAVAAATSQHTQSHRARRASFNNGREAAPHVGNGTTPGIPANATPPCTSWAPSQVPAARATNGGDRCGCREAAPTGAGGNEASRRSSRRCHPCEVATRQAIPIAGGGAPQDHRQHAACSPKKAPTGRRSTLTPPPLAAARSTNPALLCRTRAPAPSPPTTAPVQAPNNVGVGRRGRHLGLWPHRSRRRRG